MIDLHCRILPALHIRHDHDVVIRELGQWVAELNAELPRGGVKASVTTRAEVAETALPGLDDEELHSASLGGGRWILLEPAPGPLGDSVDAAVETLKRRGFRSVIAHPERHPHADLSAHLGRLVRRGALVQVTAALLEHDHASPVIVELARRGLVHLLGSDGHSSRAGRAVRLSGGFAALRETEQLGGAGRADAVLGARRNPGRRGGRAL